ncbi:MAG: 30S ribosomal protein S2 [DPANN group archaeon]|nr:30S ribosomal protein S2 [DPANN group archaeon]
MEQTLTKQTIIPLEQFIASGIHIGTKFKTKHMSPYIYKVNPNGLCVLDIEKVNNGLLQAIQTLAKYEPGEIVIVSRRENGWKPVKAFAKATGIKHVFAGRYPAGTITNPNLETFFEPRVMLIVDPFPDKNAVKDAINIGIPIIGLCDSNNTTENINIIVPCNNKGAKSLGLIFWILAREYLKSKGLIKSDEEFQISVDDFSNA